MRFGVREICDVVFKPLTSVDIGNQHFDAMQPVLYLDTAKTSTLEGAATTVYAQGGKGNPRLIGWDGEKTLTFTIEDALMSPVSFSMLSGAGVIQGVGNHTNSNTDEQKIYVHRTYDLVVEGSSGNFYAKLPKEVRDGATLIATKEAPIYATVLDSAGGQKVFLSAIGQAEISLTPPINGTGTGLSDKSTGNEIFVSADSVEGVTEVWIYRGVAYATEALAEAAADAAVPVIAGESEQDRATKVATEKGKIQHRSPVAAQNAQGYIEQRGAINVSPQQDLYFILSSDGTPAQSINYTDSRPEKFEAGDAVRIDCYAVYGEGAQELQITADSFAGYYYIEASTLFRDEATGRDFPAEFIIPRGKIQSNFTFTMAASGDPSTFTFTIDAFPAYTKFNKSKKVMAALQILDPVAYKHNYANKDIWGHDGRSNDEEAYENIYSNSIFDQLGK